MSFSRAFISCYQYHMPVRLDSIMANNLSLIFCGDQSYNDGQVGLASVPFNGDFVDSYNYFPAFVGATVTIGAAATVNGVAGQLPLGAVSSVSAGGSGAPAPANGTYTAMLQQVSNGVKGGAVVTVTITGGAVTAASVLTPGKGYTGGAGASYTLYATQWCGASDFAIIDRKFAQLYSLPEWVWYQANRKAAGHESIWIFDDHDRCANNRDWSTAAAAPGETTAQRILDSWRGIAPRLEAAAALNADNSPVDDQPDVPSALLGITGTNGALASGHDFKRWYFYRDCDDYGLSANSPVNKNVGAGAAVVREIYLDCVSYKSPQAATDNAAKTMLGATQKAWFKAACLDARAKGLMVVVYSDKDLFNVDNSDGFVSFVTERDELLLFWETNDVWGGWMTGDRHCAHCAITTTKTPAGSGVIYNHVSVCGTPFGSVMGQVSPASVTDTGNTPYKEMVWQYTERAQGVYGRVTWNTTLKQLEFQVLDNCDDTEQFFCAVSLGARAPLPSQIRTARAA